MGSMDATWVGHRTVHVLQEPSPAADVDESLLVCSECRALKDSATARGMFQVVGAVGKLPHGTHGVAGVAGKSAGDTHCVAVAC